MVTLAVDRGGTMRAGAVHGPAKGPKRTWGTPEVTGLETSTSGWQAPSAVTSGALQATAEAFLRTAVTRTVSPGRYASRSVTADIPTWRDEHVGTLAAVPPVGAAVGAAAVDRAPAGRT